MTQYTWSGLDPQYAEQIAKTRAMEEVRRLVSAQLPESAALMAGLAEAVALTRDTTTLVPVQGAVANGIADDTAIIQALIDANPSYTVIDGGGRNFGITGLTIPNGSTFLTLQNFRFTLIGDVVALKGVNAAALVLFFTLENVFIDATDHSTTGRHCIEFTNFSLSTFVDVWISPSSGKTIGLYGIKNTGGSAPYYNQFIKVYTGDCQYGLYSDDGGSDATGCNSNEMSAGRFQPGTGNVAVHISRYSQAWKIWGVTFESTGGTGIDNDGISTNIEGCRFEALTLGINHDQHATDYFDHGNYYNSCTADRAVHASATALAFVNPVLTAASTTARSGLRVPHGTAPTSPVDGDIWTTTLGEFVRRNGATKTLLAGGDNVTLGTVGCGALTGTSFVQGTEVRVSGTKIAGARDTGWTAPTGTTSKGAFNTDAVTSYTAPDISNPPTEAEVQAIADKLEDVTAQLITLSQRHKALVDAITTHGLVGV